MSGLKQLTHLCFVLLMVVFLLGCEKQNTTTESNTKLLQHKEASQQQPPKVAETKERVKTIPYLGTDVIGEDDDYDVEKEVTEALGKLSPEELHNLIKKHDPNLANIIAKQSGIKVEKKTLPSNVYKDQDVIALCKAAQSHDIKEIDRLIKKGTDINTKGKQGIIPLLFAFHPSGKKTFLAMLKLGADPNIIIMPRGDSMTHLVSGIMEDSDWLEMVLKNGGDPNVKSPAANFGQDTPIFEAINANNLKNVKLLIQSGADINHQDTSGGTPAMSASVFRRYHIIYVLLQAGADWKIKNKYDQDLAFDCYCQPVMSKEEFPEEHGYNLKVLKFLKIKGIDLEATKMKVFKKHGSVGDIIKREYIYYETETNSFGKIIKSDPYIPKGWKRVVIKNPIENN